MTTRDSFFLSTPSHVRRRTTLGESLRCSATLLEDVLDEIRGLDDSEKTARGSEMCEPGEEGSFRGVTDFLVVEILGHLVESPWDVARFGRTCRRLNRLVMSQECLWPRADPGALRTRCPGLLRLAGTLSLIDDAFELDEVPSLFHNMPRLRALRVDSYLLAFEARAVALLRSLPPSLVSITLGPDLMPGHHWIPSALERCGGVRSLELVGEWDCCAREVWEMAPKCLQSLRVNATDLRLLNFAKLPARERLVELHVRSSRKEFVCDYAALSSCCPNLQSLHLDVFETCQGLRALSRLKRLTELSLVLNPCDTRRRWLLEYSSDLGAMVTREEYASMTQHQRYSLWCSTTAVELEELANAEDWAPLCKVMLQGFSVDLSGFLRGRRCMGHLRDITLKCRTPVPCRDIVPDFCGLSLCKASRCRATGSDHLVELLSRPEGMRPRLHEIRLLDFDQEGLDEIFGSP